MEKKDLVEGMRLYIYKLRVDGRYSTAKSYQDALNSFMRFCGLEVIPYIYVNKENLRRYQAFLLNKGCTWNTVSTYMRRIRCVYNMAVEEGLAPYIPYLFKGVFTGIESKRKSGTEKNTAGIVPDVPVLRYGIRGFRSSEKGECPGWGFGI